MRVCFRQMPEVQADQDQAGQGIGHGKIGRGHPSWSKLSMNRPKNRSNHLLQTKVPVISKRPTMDWMQIIKLSSVENSRGKWANQFLFLNAPPYFLD